MCGKHGHAQPMAFRAADACWLVMVGNGHQQHATVVWDALVLAAEALLSDALVPSGSLALRAGVLRQLFVCM